MGYRDVQVNATIAKSEEVSPDEEARARIERMREECREAAEFHSDQASKLHRMAELHDYAASQFRMFIESGDPVPDEAVQRVR